LIAWVVPEVSTTSLREPALMKAARLSRARS